MHWRDFGSLLWVLIVIGGVVSSVRKAASRSQTPASARLREPAGRPKAAPTPAAALKVSRSIAAQALADAAYRAQLAASLPVAAPTAPPPPEPIEALAEMPAMPAMPTMPAMESFGDPPPSLRASANAPHPRARSEWARGVVLAELLAPPLAMRESGPPTW